MDPYGGPAALGGVMTGLMLASWMLGRWQSRPNSARAIGEAPPAPSEALPAVRPSCEAVPTERPERENAYAALCELHEDVSAYRKAQQILSDNPLTAAMQVGWTASGEDAVCQFLGANREPHRPAARVVADPLCGCAACNAAPTRPATEALTTYLQPSAEPVVFTRV